jgi:hypothetical protein
MTETGQLLDANHYVFEGNGISGVVDTASLDGRPTASVTVDGSGVNDFTIEHGKLGWSATAGLGGQPDRYTRSVTLLMPGVRSDGGAEAFEGLAILVTRRTGLDGGRSIKGPIESYEVRTIGGRASVVHS